MRSIEDKKDICAQTGKGCSKKRYTKKSTPVVKQKKDAVAVEKKVKTEKKQERKTKTSILSTTKDKAETKKEEQEPVSLSPM